MQKPNIKNKEDILNLVTDILVKDFECDPVVLKKPGVRLFEDLDLDSIDAVDLIVKLQQITGKKVNPEEFKQVRSLDDVIDAIHRLFTL